MVIVRGLKIKQDCCLHSDFTEVERGRLGAGGHLTSGWVRVAEKASVQVCPDFSVRSVIRGQRLYLSEQKKK